MLRLAAVLGPGVITGLFETIRHEYLENWLPHAPGNAATGVLVVGASAVLLTQIFKRLDRFEQEFRRAKARHTALRERERIAADLHDYVSQSLFYMNVVLGSVERDVARGDPDSGRRKAQGDPPGGGAAVRPHPPHDFRSQDAGSRGGARLSRAGAAHRRAVFQKQRHSGGIKGVVARVRRRLSGRGAGDAGDLAGSAQQATRHARPRRIAAAVGSDAERDWLMVEDDGVGFDVDAAPGVEEGHFGLAFMRQRAQHFGGELTVDSRPHHGTAVRFERRRRPAAGAAS